MKKRLREKRLKRDGLRFAKSVKDFRFILLRQMRDAYGCIVKRDSPDYQLTSIIAIQLNFQHHIYPVLSKMYDNLIREREQSGTHR